MTSRRKPFFHAARPKPEAPKGLPARKAAAQALEQVLVKRVTLDACFDTFASALEPLDRGLAHRIALTTLRHLGWCRMVLNARAQKGLPDGLHRLESALLTGLAQVLFLDVPDHAAVDCAVQLVRADSRTAGFSGLANAILRGVAREKEAVLAGLDPLDNLSPFLRPRWVAAYGEEGARAMALAVLQDAPLDLTVKSDAAGWAGRLGGRLLPQGSVRLDASGLVTALPGFSEGQWWVQDAAASLPARLFGPLDGLKFADFCAAPGGKSAQLAVLGAKVTAFDRSAPRLKRLRENMQRLALDVAVEQADAAILPPKWNGFFDGVLVDAPCSATGTLRDHPDIGWLKGEEDVASLVGLQRRLLEAAVRCVKPGGLIVYSTCSLEREESEDQIAAFLAATAEVERVPLRAEDVPGVDKFLNSNGDLRTVPSDWQSDGGRGGIDGFFCARLRRRA